MSSPHNDSAFQLERTQIPCGLRQGQASEPCMGSRFKSASATSASGLCLRFPLLTPGCLGAPSQSPFACDGTQEDRPALLTNSVVRHCRWPMVSWLSRPVFNGLRMPKGPFELMPKDTGTGGNAATCEERGHSTGRTFVASTDGHMLTAVPSTACHVGMILPMARLFFS